MPGLFIIPHTGTGFLHNTRGFSASQAHRNNDHHPTKPRQQHQSTHQQSLAALTTSSPLQQDKTWPGGSIYTPLSVFQEKDYTHSLPYFSSQDVSEFQILSRAACNISLPTRRCQTLSAGPVFFFVCMIMATFSRSHKG